MSEPTEPKRESVKDINFGDVVLVSNHTVDPHSAIILRRLTEDSAETALINSGVEGQEILSIPSSTSLSIMSVSGEQPWSKDRITRGLAGRYAITPEDEIGYAHVRAIVEAYAAL